MARTPASPFTRFTEICYISTFVALGMTLVGLQVGQLQDQALQVGTLFALNAEMAQDLPSSLAQLAGTTDSGRACTLNLVPGPDQHTSLMVLSRDAAQVTFQITSNRPVSPCGTVDTFTVSSYDAPFLVGHMAAPRPDAPIPTTHPTNRTYALLQ